MSQAVQPFDPETETETETEAERQLLEAAIAAARADPHYVDHQDMRAWLLRLAQGEFDAELPELRTL